MISEYQKNERLIALVEIGGALTIIGYWIGWFLDVLKSLESDDPGYDSYIDHESSFPLPDAWIVLLLLISAYGILRNEAFGRPTAIAAGGALVFLGLIDIAFNFQQNIYSQNPLEIAINTASVVGGLFLIGWFGFISTRE
ncbi:MAG: hypothetical protein ACXACI_10125 [Candidatus Hodarchaeales archaeon]|jgi:hypothetical protein